jgi:hypothetical protein
MISAQKFAIYCTMFVGLTVFWEGEVFSRTVVEERLNVEIHHVHVSPMPPAKIKSNSCEALVSLSSCYTCYNHLQWGGKTQFLSTPQEPQDKHDTDQCVRTPAFLCAGDTDTYVVRSFHCGLLKQLDSTASWNIGNIILLNFHGIWIQYKPILNHTRYYLGRVSHVIGGLIVAT